MTKKVWVIIAAYNEEKHIGAVIDETKKFCKNIVVVDDGSKDNTYKIAKSKKISVLKHQKNKGKGIAARNGCDYALKKGADKIILLDGDGQHEPKEIPNFLKQLKKKDIVFGYRKLNNKMPLLFRFGNWFINITSQVLFGIKLKDSQCGYRAFTAETYKKVQWKSSNYAMESEMITKVGKNKLKYSEIPIKTIYKNKYKGTTPLDGINIVLKMIMWKAKGK